MNKPSLTQTPDTMHFSWAEGIDVDLERFHDSHGEITAEATVFSRVTAFPGLLHHARLNLMSTQARTTLARQLATRVKDDIIDWPVLLEQLCYLAVDAYREGDPIVDLRDVDPWVKTRWLIYPYVEYGGPTILYAEGGSGKSVIAMWIGLQVALGTIQARGESQARPVLYLDYETSATTHAERMNALYRGMGIDMEARAPFYYKRMSVNLPEAIQSLQREISDKDIGLVIVDSLGAAGSGAPEDASTAVPIYQALRKLPIPALCIHHKNKNKGDTSQSNQRDRAFGSVYYLNYARLAWEMEAVQGDGVLTAGLVNVKCNNGRPLPKHALRITFTDMGPGDDRLKSIVVEKHDIADVPGLEHKIPLKERILRELRQGARTMPELAEVLAIEESTLKPRLSELKARGTIVNLPDRRWGLAADPDESSPF